jgi:hypothetical protein
MPINEFTQIWSILGTIGFCVVFAGRIIYSIYKNTKRVQFINKFSDYRSVLEYNMEKAYDMIHKEHILVYSLDAYRLEDEQFNRISMDFVKLVEKFIGPMMLKEFIELYGDEDTFIFNVLDYFSVKYETDEIRNTALEQITDAEVDEQIKEGYNDKR